MKRFTKLFAIAAVVLMASLFAFVYVKAIHTRDEDKVASVVQEVKPVTKEELLRLVNAERAKSGVAPLTEDERLNISAQRKANDMQKYDYYDHVSPHDNKHGYDYINDTDITCKTDGENLNNVTGDYISSIKVVASWMDSKPHHDAILNGNYSLTGFGISNVNNRVLVVEHFCEV